MAKKPSQKRLEKNNCLEAQVNLQGTKQAVSSTVRRGLPSTAGVEASLEHSSAERDFLADEFSIPAPQFFLDQEVFDALSKKIFSKILNRPPEEPIRIWVIGRWPDREAYSIAMVLREFLGENAADRSIRIFASGIDKKAVGPIRSDVYSQDEVRQVSNKRLTRFFNFVGGGYQVDASIRDICLFARHDLMRDPPFYKLDLVSCRNVMIHSEPLLQRKAMAAFYRCLKDNGRLLLGKGEMPAGCDELFTLTDRSLRFFQKNLDARIPLNHALLAYEYVATRNKALKAANAEAHSNVENLRTANEELQTINEALHTSREQLTLLNEQLQSRNDELLYDLNSVLSGVDVPIVILGSDECIRRFTPPAANLLGLMAGDIGRPISELGSRLGASNFSDLIASAIRKSEEAAVEVRTESGRWCLLRIHPFHAGKKHVPGILMVFVDITERKQTERKLLDYRDQLRRLTGALLSAQESGNRELAREMHDVFSQELAAAGMDISALKDRLNGDVEVVARLSEVGQKLGRLSADIHRASRELHPAILHELGLEPALLQECETFQHRFGIMTDFAAKNVPAAIPKGAALCLYRVAQECLRNVAKHARNATNVRVLLSGNRSGVTLSIEDTGDGFNLQEPFKRGGLGLTSMEERLRLVNGKLTVQSEPGKGTVVTAVVPLNLNKETQ